MICLLPLCDIQVACQYQIMGVVPNPFYDHCCPLGVTNYYSPERLRGLAGYPRPQITSTRRRSTLER